MVPYSEVPIKGGQTEAASSVGAAPQGIHVQVDEEEMLHPVSPPLVQPAASRLISCLRAPCLKRNPSHSPTTSGSISPVSESTSSESSSPPSGNLIASACSFAAVKTVSSLPPKRQVHFDAAPPEAGLTHSRDHYDRRPIECTQGGSASDLSLPPRGTFPKYSTNGEDGSIDEVQDVHRSQTWARSIDGALLGGAGSTSFKKHKQTSIGGQADDLDENACTVPRHGVRSFGRIAQKSDFPEDRKDSDDESEDSDTTNSKVEVDFEVQHDAFRRAVYAALSLSPNATPMPSPSVRTRWECAASYFDRSDDADALDKSSGATTPGQSIMEETPSLAESHHFSPPREGCPIVSVQKEFHLNLPCAKKSTHSVDSSTNNSSSPMSSRCSSTDTWSSGGLGSMEAENSIVYEKNFEDKSSRHDDLDTFAPADIPVAESELSSKTSSEICSSSTNISRESKAREDTSLKESPQCVSNGSRKIGVRSAPTSSDHSPDETSEENGTHSPSQLREPRKLRKERRSSSSTGVNDDQEDRRSRNRRPSNSRSKSMSSAFTSIKRSSFPATTFCTEIEDEGALGGF